MSKEGESDPSNSVLGRYLRGAGTLAPDLKLWVAAGAGIIVLAELRRRRRVPTPPPTFFKSYMVTCSSIALATITAYYPLNKESNLVESDRDLEAVDQSARRQAREWVKTRASRSLPSSLDSDYDPVGLGQRTPRDGLSYLSWKIRGHFWQDDRAWNHFYRTLALRYADKYPEITPAAWDACVSHFARAAFLEEAVVPVRELTASTHLWLFLTFIAGDLLEARPSVLRFGITVLRLNTIFRAVCYGVLTLHVLPLPSMVLYYRRLTGLQDKTRVAEMLREAYPDSG